MLAAISRAKNSKKIQPRVHVMRPAGTKRSTAKMTNAATRRFIVDRHCTGLTPSRFLHAQSWQRHLKYSRSGANYREADAVKTSTASILFPMCCQWIACGMPNQMQSATQSAIRNCPVGFGFRVCLPQRLGRDCGTPKPGKKKQKRYDYACAVLVIHRFPFSLLLT